MQFRMNDVMQLSGDKRGNGYPQVATGVVEAVRTPFAGEVLEGALGYSGAGDDTDSADVVGREGEQALVVSVDAKPANDEFSGGKDGIAGDDNGLG